MHIGAVFPQQAIPSSAAEFRRFAQMIEGHGFDHLLLYDHVLGAVRANRTPPLGGPFDETSVFYEPFTLASFLAGVTDSLELATGVLVLPQRPTALVAKEAAAVSLLADGRFRLGVGVGYNHAEFEAMGAEFTGRGGRQEEQIEVLRQLWTQGVVDYSGKWHRIDRMAIAPRPIKPIPLWLGGHSDAALERSSRLADGHIVGIRRDPVEVIEVLTANLASHGRDPSEFGFDVVVLIGDTERAWADTVARVSAAGATKVSLSTQELEAPYEEQIEILLDAYQLTKNIVDRPDSPGVVRS